MERNATSTLQLSPFYDRDLVEGLWSAVIWNVFQENVSQMTSHFYYTASFWKHDTINKDSLLGEPINLAANYNVSRFNQ